MRAFIAIKAPSFLELTKQLEAKGVKTVNDFHITLKFLGEIDYENVPEIKKVIESIKFQPYELKATKIDLFPNDKNIRVIWLETKDNGETQKIQRELEEKLSKMGFPKEKRKFEQHLTLARVKFVDNKEELKNKIKNIKINESTFKVEKIILFESELRAYGPIYTEV